MSTSNDQYLKVGVDGSTTNYKNDNLCIETWDVTYNTITGLACVKY